MKLCNISYHNHFHLNRDSVSVEKLGVGWKIIHHPKGHVDALKFIRSRHQGQSSSHPDMAAILYFGSDTLCPRHGYTNDDDDDDVS